MKVGLFLGVTTTRCQRVFAMSVRMPMLQYITSQCSALKQIWLQRRLGMGSRLSLVVNKLQQSSFRIKSILFSGLRWGGGLTKMESFHLFDKVFKHCIKKAQDFLNLLRTVFTKQSLFIKFQLQFFGMNYGSKFALISSCARNVLLLLFLVRTNIQPNTSEQLTLWGEMTGSEESSSLSFSKCMVWLEDKGTLCYSKIKIVISCRLGRRLGVVAVLHWARYSRNFPLTNPTYTGRLFKILDSCLWMILNFSVIRLT
jgi:hypothetical protein